MAPFCMGQTDSGHGTFLHGTGSAFCKRQDLGVALFSSSVALSRIVGGSVL